MDANQPIRVDQNHAIGGVAGRLNQYSTLSCLNFANNAAQPLDCYDVGEFLNIEKLVRTVFVVFF